MLPCPAVQVASILEFIDQRCSPEEQQQQVQEQQGAQQDGLLDMSPSKRKEPGGGPSPVLDAGSTVKKRTAGVGPLLPMAAAGAAAAAAIAAEPSKLTSGACCAWMDSPGRGSCTFERAACVTPRYERSTKLAALCEHDYQALLCALQTPQQ